MMTKRSFIQTMLLLTRWRPRLLLLVLPLLLPTGLLLVGLPQLLVEILVLPGDKIHSSNESVHQRVTTRWTTIRLVLRSRLLENLQLLPVLLRKSHKMLPVLLRKSQELPHVPLRQSQKLLLALIRQSQELLLLPHRQSQKLLMDWLITRLLVLLNKKLLLVRLRHVNKKLLLVLLRHVNKKLLLNPDK
jgi:hypothetical protein